MKGKKTEEEKEKVKKLVLHPAKTLRQYWPDRALVREAEKSIEGTVAFLLLSCAESRNGQVSGRVHRCYLPKTDQRIKEKGHMQTVTFNSIEKLDFRTKESYKTLRTNLEFSGKDRKVISVTSSTQ